MQRLQGFKALVVDYFRVLVLALSTFTEIKHFPETAPSHSGSVGLNTTPGSISLISVIEAV